MGSVQVPVLQTGVKIMMYLFWGLLTFTILNELFELYHIQEFYTYLFATTLCTLHIYNLKYCRCVDDDCCVHSTKKIPKKFN